MDNTTFESEDIFNEWNEEKKKLHRNKKYELVFHEREIWWCSLGKNLGDEQDGKNASFERPVIVIKKFNSRIAWVVPMSTKMKNGKYYHSIFHNKAEKSVILSQLRLTSIKRFKRFIGKITPFQYITIKKKISKLLW